MVAEIILISQGDGADAARQSAQYVARGLSSIGYKVREKISVCESVRQLQQAVSAALGRSHVLVTLGGLGADTGYMAKTTMAQGLRLPLELNNEALSALRSYCHRTGEPYSLADNELAKLPRGSVAFPGSHGKTPGCVISSSKQHIVLLPENQAEVMPMFNRYVSPYLGGKATTTVTRTVRTYGVTEKAVRDMLAPLMNTANPAVTVAREQNEVLVRVTAHAETAQQAASQCTPVLRSIVDKVGDAAYGLDVDSLQSALVAKLNKKDLDVAVAEAGTGGMLTRVLTETEGGQEVLRYSVAVDEDAAKTEKLGLKPKLLKKRGGVSEYAAVAMASAAREKVHTAVGIGVTACTEDNATKKCPAGLVYIAVCDAEHVYVKKLVIGEGDAPYDAIIDAALSRALNMARLFVDYLPGRYPGSVSLLEALDGKAAVTDRDSYDTGYDEDEPPEEEKERRGVGDRIRRAVFVVAVLVFVCSASYIGYSMYKSYEAKQIAVALGEMFEYGEMGDVEIADDYPGDYQLKFAGLWNVNPDVQAFIRIEDTSVNYPIVQSGDNDYYLRRDFYEKSNQHGVPFLDFRVDVEKPSDNMVVYGHNMTDGQIFGELIKYRDLDYYKEHPTIDFSTVYRDGTYKIFSVFITNAYIAQGHVFDYYNFIEAESDAQFAEFLEQLEYRSLINTTVDVEPGDELITLSTCEYDFKDARLVVVARRTRRGEDEKVNVADAALNPQPLYPDIWYQTFGGTKPDGIDSNWSVGQNASSYIGYQGDDTAPAVAQSSTQATEAATQATEPPTQAETEAETEPESTSATEAETAAPTEAATQAVSEINDMGDVSGGDDPSRLEEERLASEAAAASEAEASRAAEEARLASEAEAASQAALEAAEASRLAAEEASENARRAAEEEASNAELMASGMSYSSKGSSGDELTVKVGGKTLTEDALDIVSRVVQNEVGASFNTEAIKAQAVATYTFIAQSNAAGTTPSVYMNDTVSPKVETAVADVIGEALYYRNQLAFTPYHATSAGSTTTSASVWGGNYPYLVAVDSTVDEKVTGYHATTTMTSDQVAKRLADRAGIDVDGDPGDWFEILTYNDGGYVGDMRIGGETKTASGSKLTGRLVRESILNLRSACFEVEYDSAGDRFTFHTYGYGHGVGMSQNGANLLAGDGWSYVDILEHYYPGTAIG